MVAVVPAGACTAEEAQPLDFALSGPTSAARRSAAVESRSMTAAWIACVHWLMRSALRVETHRQAIEWTARSVVSRHTEGVTHTDT